MILRELIKKETERILNGEIVPNGSKFIVIKVSREQHATISIYLNNIGIDMEEMYGDRFKGYIWLRWGTLSRKFVSYLNYYSDGTPNYNSPLYDSCDITTIGEFLTMKGK